MSNALHITLQALRNEFQKAVDANPELRMLIVRALPGHEELCDPLSLPPSYKDHVRGDAYSSSHWATVWGNCLFSRYLYGPSQQLRTFLKLAHRAWCTLPEAMQRETLKSLEVYCPVSRNNWPRNQDVVLWPGYHAKSSDMCDPEMRRLLTAPVYQPDWSFFVYAKLKQHPGSWFQRDNELVVTIETSAGKLDDRDFSARQEDFAQPLLARPHNRWRITELHIDVFTASLVATDLLLAGQPSGKPNSPAAVQEFPSEEDSNQPIIDDLPSIPGLLKLIPGGFVYRERQTEDLSGKPWQVLRKILQSRIGRITSRGLLATVWKDKPDTTDQNVKDAISTVRQALRRAMKRAGVKRPSDPLPAVDQGCNLSWKLDLGQD
jgi:hypothetical protein